jgi:CRP-like cAMP-binding protein
MPTHSNGHTQVKLEISQEEIGRMIGLSRETVVRAMSRLKKRRIIGFRNPTLTICDKSALARIAEPFIDEKEADSDLS